MRQFFLALFLIFSIPVTIFAREYNFNGSGGDKIKASVVGSTATIVYTHTSATVLQTTLTVWRTRGTNGALSDRFYIDDLQFGSNNPGTKIFTVPDLRTDPSTTYYLTIGSSVFPFSTDGYRIIFSIPSISAAGSSTLQAEFQAPPEDQRDLTLFLSTDNPALTSIAFGKEHWIQNATGVPLGKVPTSGKGSKIVTPPSGNSGDWYYAALAAKKTDGTYELLSTLPLPAQFGTESKIYAAPLSITLDGDDVVIRGKIDTSKHFNYADFSIILELSKGGPFSSDPKETRPDALPFNATKTPEIDGPRGIASDGSYYWKISGRLLDAGTVYYLRQTITAPKTASSNGTVDVVLDKFNSTKGYTPAGSSAEQNDFEKRSYRLLAPFPGLAVLLNPDLCLEMIKEKKSVPEMCTAEDPSSISGFINYIFKILIGLSAVLLVLRLIFEGYQYIVTDVPFLKMNAKSKIGQASLGLLLALSAYLLLNTINPKLVSNTISLQTINVDIEEEEGYQATIAQDPDIVPSGSVAKCLEGIERIVTKTGAMNLCKNIAGSVKSMIDLAWSQGIKLSGGGFRTYDQQIEVRKKNCGVSNIFVKNAKCVPPTAYPGNSNHESGLAIDFMCEGKTIATKDNKCFLWLQANAKNYKLINFPKEPWHWSTNGK